MIDDEALRNIEKLHKMKQDGIISGADFEKAKENLLAGRTKPKPQPRLATANEPSSLPVEDDNLAWALLPLRRYSDFTGRSTRKEYWMFQLIFVAAFFVCAALSVIAGSETAAGLFILCLLGLFVPLIAVQVRSLHDRDMSGWIVLFNLLPYLGALVILVLMMLDGTPGPNRFGDDPKGR
jgi:uncharacterized membrane protein YhaH (DUF805 family)